MQPLRLFAKENHCKNVGFTATNLFDGMKMVMCSIFVYTYIHTYIHIYIYYVCIHRQTNIQTYNSVCAYMYICTHNQPYDMDLFENGLDFSSAKKK